MTEGPSALSWVTTANVSISSGYFPLFLSQWDCLSLSLFLSALHPLIGFRRAAPSTTHAPFKYPLQLIIGNLARRFFLRRVDEKQKKKNIIKSPVLRRRRRNIIIYTPDLFFIVSVCPTLEGPSACRVSFTGRTVASMPSRDSPFFFCWHPSSSSRFSSVADRYYNRVVNLRR